MAGREAAVSAEEASVQLRNDAARRVRLRRCDAALPHCTESLQRFQTFPARLKIYLALRVELSRPWRHCPRLCIGFSIRSVSRGNILHAMEVRLLCGAHHCVLRRYNAGGAWQTCSFGRILVRQREVVLQTQHSESVRDDEDDGGERAGLLVLHKLYWIAIPRRDLFVIGSVHGRQVQPCPERFCTGVVTSFTQVLGGPVGGSGTRRWLRGAFDNRVDLEPATIKVASSRAESSTTVSSLRTPSQVDVKVSRPAVLESFR